MKHILLTCGIGDFIAMESYFTPAERKDIQAIHWASRARVALQELIPFVLPGVREHIIERDTWGAPFSKTFCISSRNELPGLDMSVRDWSVKFIIKDVQLKRRTYQGSTFVSSKLCDISHLDLPERYFVIHPYSENARTPIRDLTTQEWQSTYSRLRSRNISMVIINKGTEQLKPLPGVIDLTNQLNLKESIEVTKRAIGFVGAASLFSVVASKIMRAENLFIKGSRDLKLNYASFYYAPHRTNSFIFQNLP